MKNAKRKMENVSRLFCVFNFAFCVAGCSIPNLESQTCIDSRPAVREFYSFHFANEMRFSPENLKLHAKYLTPDFAHRLKSWQSSGDPFTTGDEDLPKAFRVGECREIAVDRSEFQVLLFWR